MSEVVYRSEVRIERVKGPVRKAISRLSRSRSFSESTARLPSTTGFRPQSRNPAPRRLITLSPPPQVDLREPLEARWRRVKSMHRVDAWWGKQ